MFTPISWLLKSRYRLPSTVKNSQPLAEATGIGRVEPCCCQSYIVCRRLRSTISSAVSSLMGPPWSSAGESGSLAPGEYHPRTRRSVAHPRSRREVMERIGHYIGGKHVPGESGRRGPVFDPATGEQPHDADFA